MRASDIDGLRTEINRVRGIVHLAPISWPAIDIVRASDFIDMRDAIQDIWSDTEVNFGTLPDWSGHTPTAENLDLAVHLMDLRTWIGRASDFPAEQGVDTYSYTPVNDAQTQWAVIGSGWRSNIQGFTSGAPDENRVKYVRCKITAKPDPDDSDKRVILSQDAESRGKFVDAFNTYKNNLRVFATLTLETYRRDSPYDEDLGTVGPVNNTSAYIEEFANEFGALHYSYFGPSGVSDYIIWNEPNDTNPASQPKALSSAQFAALLRRCWQKVVLPLPVPSRPRIYWGGILFTGVDSLLNPNSGQVDYVSEVYSHVRAQLAADPEAQRPPDDKLPWDGINIHLHHTPREDTTSGGVLSFMKNLMRDHIWPIQIENGDGGWILVGEWGVTRQNLDDEDSLAKAFQRIRPWSTTMFYFTHPDFPQSGSDEGDWWGLANRTEQSGLWVAANDVPQGPKYRDALD